MYKNYKYIFLISAVLSIGQSALASDKQENDAAGNPRNNWVSFGGASYKVSDAEREQAFSGPRLTNDSQGGTKYGIDALNKDHPLSNAPSNE